MGRPIGSYTPQPAQHAAPPAMPYLSGSVAAPALVQHPRTAPGAVRPPGAGQPPGAYGDQVPPGSHLRPLPVAHPSGAVGGMSVGRQLGPHPAVPAPASVSHVAYPPSTPARQPLSPAAAPRQPQQGILSPPPLAVNVATPPRNPPGLGVPAGFVPGRGPPVSPPPQGSIPAYRGGLAARPMPGYSGGPPLGPGPPGAPAPHSAEGYAGGAPAMQGMSQGHMGPTPGGATGAAGYFGAPAPAKRNDPRPALAPQMEMVGLAGSGLERPGWGSGSARSTRLIRGRLRPPRGLHPPAHRGGHRQTRPRPGSTPPQVFETRRGGDHSIPPPCSTPLVVRDRGSAGPHHMRSTLNLVPQVRRGGSEAFLHGPGLALQGPRASVPVAGPGQPVAPHRPAQLSFGFLASAPGAPLGPEFQRHLPHAIRLPCTSHTQCSPL